MHQLWQLAVRIANGDVLKRKESWDTEMHNQGSPADLVTHVFFAYRYYIYECSYSRAGKSQSTRGTPHLLVAASGTVVCRTGSLTARQSGDITAESDGSPPAANTGRMDGPTVVAVSGISTAAVAVARLLTGRLVAGKLGWDDWDGRSCGAVLYRPDHGGHLVLALPVYLVTGLQMTRLRKAVVYWCSAWAGWHVSARKSGWHVLRSQLEATISITTVSLPAPKVFTLVVPWPLGGYWPTRKPGQLSKHLE